jgi:hypothetical protein
MVNDNEYVDEAKSFADKRGVYSNVFLTMNDDYFKLPVSEQYQIASKLYKKIDSKALLGAIVIKNKNSESIYDIFLNLLYEKYFSGITDTFYIYGLDIAFDRKTIKNNQLDGLDKNKIMNSTVKEFESALDIKKHNAYIIDENKRNQKAVEKEEKRKESLIGANPSIGMTMDEVINSSWGEPEDINKTTTEYGTSEQWVYSRDRYIYFDDNKVTAIQE